LDFSSVDPLLNTRGVRVRPELISTRGEENEKSPRLSYLGTRKVAEKACVFVDGENLRHSLIDVFARDGTFRSSDYLPAAAEWAAFFDWIVSVATSGTHHRLRTYWFVIQDLDFFPFGLNQIGKGANEQQLNRVLLRYRPLRERLRELNGEERLREMDEALTRLKDSQHAVETQFKRWLTVQNGIAIRHRAIEFRRSGAIVFNLFERQFGREKSVDVRLACDMLMLRDIYDTAIIVSGDQDYVPAAQVLKDAGKTVINVSFERRNGDLLPGGARRLNIATDASIRVPYAKLRCFMGLDLPPNRPEEGPAARALATV
jgi:uncharacterized LabA/DUF88 family protein